jgi:hypothetical protein
MKNSSHQNILVFCMGLLCSASTLAQGLSLTTQTEKSVGVSLSHYKYKEPGFMSLQAKVVGIDYAGTYAFAPQWPRIQQTWFVRGELAYQTGRADYTSVQSSVVGTENWYGEARALVGRDVQFGQSVLSPYIGLGLRHLHNDLRAENSLGYRRITRYVTLPIGVSHKQKWSKDSVLVTHFEYLHLVQGTHWAKLSDSSPFSADVKLKQPKGHGIRAGALWRFDNWSMGPTLSYWNIDQSDPKGQSVIEPSNNTVEFGFRLNYLF